LNLIEVTLKTQLRANFISLISFFDEEL